tara:strand:- start:699 stop:1592 length:894 start_codon:yes stop_codon:yes gene_type:complete
MAGCGGMLGEAFFDEFKKENQLCCSDLEVNDNWLHKVDFRDSISYEKDVYEFKPDWLFHLGAHTSLEYCEKNPEDTYETNTESVKTAVKISNSLSIPLLYISTAGIFSGEKEYFDENDTPNPLGHYAKSKYLGEKFVIENSKDFLICRAGWMMGGGLKKDKKFIAKIIKQIIGGAKELNIVDDKDGTPTYTLDFSKNVKYLIENKKKGLYNMVCSGMTSRLEVAKKLLNILGIENEITIKPVPSSYFAEEYFAERPPNERLISKKLNDEGMNIMQDWDVALEDYIQKRFSSEIKKIT